MDFLHRMDEMVEYALANDVDLVVFAGDAFKSRNPSPTFQREFAYRIQDLTAHAPVVLLVGNHDLPMIEKARVEHRDLPDAQRAEHRSGARLRVHKIATKRGEVLVATAPYPVRSLLRDADTPHIGTIAEDRSGACAPA